MRRGLAVFCLVLVAALGAAQARPLAPNQAFRFHATLVGHRLRVRWTAAPGYHLYRNRIHLRVAPRSVRLAPFRLPPGRWVNDPALGHQQVYEGRTSLTIPFVQRPAVSTIDVVARYQGCANAGICYPPLTKTIVLRWPSGGGARPSAVVGPAAPAAGAKPTPEPVSWAVLLLFWVAGIGLAFTPCVFPMIPILSAVIVAQGPGRGPARPWLLSASYVLGMALTYTVAGVVAAVTGRYLQAAFQNPWVITAFSGLFVLLALSLFGLYELQVPVRLQGWASRYGRGGQMVGTFVLGALSALIVGPCVAAPLAAALLLISRSGDPVFGGLALFALSIGMGLPLLIIGTSAGRLLPKAGPWLGTTRTVFGVVLLGVAVWLESRILPGPVTLVLWALLAIVTAVTMGALEPLAPAASGGARFAKGLGVAVLAYGLALGVGGLSGATSALAPLAALSGRPPLIRPLRFETIHNVREWQAALAAAHGRPVMVDLWASWCVQCRRMEANTFTKARVQRALASYVVVRGDVTADNAESRALLARLHAFGPPTMVFFNRKGVRLTSIAGYEGPNGLVRRLAALATKKPAPRSRSKARA